MSDTFITKVDQIQSSLNILIERIDATEGKVNSLGASFDSLAKKAELSENVGRTAAAIDKFTKTINTEMLEKFEQKVVLLNESLAKINPGGLSKVSTVLETINGVSSALDPKRIIAVANAIKSLAESAALTKGLKIEVPKFGAIDRDIQQLSVDITRIKATIDGLKSTNTTINAISKSFYELAESVGDTFGIFSASANDAESLTRNIHAINAAMTQMNTSNYSELADKLKLLRDLYVGVASAEASIGTGQRAATSPSENPVSLNARGEILQRKQDHKSFGPPTNEDLFPDDVGFQRQNAVSNYAKRQLDQRINTPGAGTSISYALNDLVLGKKRGEAPGDILPEPNPAQINHDATTNSYSTVGDKIMQASAQEASNNRRAMMDAIEASPFKIAVLGTTGSNVGGASALSHSAALGSGGRAEYDHVAVGFKDEQGQYQIRELLGEMDKTTDRNKTGNPALGTRNPGGRSFEELARDADRIHAAPLTGDPNDERMQGIAKNFIGQMDQLTKVGTTYSFVKDEESARKIGADIGETCATTVKVALERSGFIEMFKGQIGNGLEGRYAKTAAATGGNLLTPTEVLDFVENATRVQKGVAPITSQSPVDEKIAKSIQTAGDIERHIKDFASTGKNRINVASEAISAGGGNIYNATKSIFDTISTNIRSLIDSLKNINLRDAFNSLVTRLSDFASGFNQKQNAPEQISSSIETQLAFQKATNTTPKLTTRARLDNLSENVYRPFQTAVSQGGAIFNGAREIFKGGEIGGAAGFLDSSGGTIKILNALSNLNNTFKLGILPKGVGELFTQRRSDTAIDLIQILVGAKTGVRQEAKPGKNSGISSGKMASENFNDSNSAEEEEFAKKYRAEAAERAKRNKSKINAATGNAAVEPTTSNNDPFKQMLSVLEQILNAIKGNKGWDASFQKATANSSVFSQQSVAGFLTPLEVDFSTKVEGMIKNFSQGTNFDQGSTGGFAVASPESVDRILRAKGYDVATPHGVSLQEYDKSGNKVAVGLAATTNRTGEASLAQTIVHEQTHNLVEELIRSGESFYSKGASGNVFDKGDVEYERQSRMQTVSSDEMVRSSILQQASTRGTASENFAKSATNDLSYYFDPKEIYAYIGESLISGKADFQNTLKSIYGKDLFDAVENELKTKISGTFGDGNIEKLQQRYTGFEKRLDTSVEESGVGQDPNDLLKKKLASTYEQISSSEALQSVGSILQESIIQQFEKGARSKVRDALSEVFDHGGVNKLLTAAERTTGVSHEPTTDNAVDVLKRIADSNPILKSAIGQAAGQAGSLTNFVTSTEGGAKAYDFGSRIAGAGVDEFANNAAVTRLAKIIEASQNLTPEQKSQGLESLTRAVAQIERENITQKINTVASKVQGGISAVEGSDTVKQLLRGLDEYVHTGQKTELNAVKDQLVQSALNTAKSGAQNAAGTVANGVITAGQNIVTSGVNAATPHIASVIGATQQSIDASIESAKIATKQSVAQLSSLIPPDVKAMIDAAPQHIKEGINDILNFADMLASKAKAGTSGLGGVALGVVNSASDTALSYAADPDKISSVLQRILKESLAPDGSGLSRLTRAAAPVYGEDFIKQGVRAADGNVAARADIIQRVTSTPDKIEDVVKNLVINSIKDEFTGDKTIGEKLRGAATMTAAAGYTFGEAAITGDKTALIKQVLPQYLQDAPTVEPEAKDEIRRRTGSRITGYEEHVSFDMSTGLNKIAVAAQTAKGAFVELNYTIDEFGRKKLDEPEKTSALGNFKERFVNQIPDEISQQITGSMINGVQEAFAKITSIQDELAEVSSIRGDKPGTKANKKGQADFLYGSVNSAIETGQGFDEAVQTNLRNVKTLGGVKDPNERFGLADQLSKVQLGAQTAFGITLDQSLESIPAVVASIQNSMTEVSDPTEKAKKSIEQLNEVMDKLVIAQRATGASGEEMIQVYANLSESAEKYKITSDQLITLTSTSAVALGKSPQETSNSLKILMESVYDKQDALRNLGTDRNGKTVSVATQVQDKKTGAIENRAFDDILKDLVSITNDPVKSNVSSNLYNVLGGKARAGEFQKIVQGYGANAERVGGALNSQYTGQNFENIVAQKSDNFQGASNKLSAAGTQLFASVLVGSGIFDKLTKFMDNTAESAQKLTQYLNENGESFGSLINKAEPFIKYFLVGRASVGTNPFSFIAKGLNSLETAMLGAQAKLLDFDSKGESSGTGFQRKLKIGVEILRELAANSESTASQLVAGANAEAAAQQVLNEELKQTVALQKQTAVVSSVNNPHVTTVLEEEGQQKKNYSTQKLAGTQKLDFATQRLSYETEALGDKPVSSHPQLAWLTPNYIEKKQKEESLKLAQIKAAGKSDIHDLLPETPEHLRLPNELVEPAVIQQGKTRISESVRGTLNSVADAAEEVADARGTLPGQSSLLNSRPVKALAKYGDVAGALAAPVGFDLLTGGINKDNLINTAGAGIAGAFAGALLGPAVAPIGYSIAQAFLASVDLPGAFGTSGKESTKLANIVLGKKQEEDLTPEQKQEQKTISNNAISNFKKQTGYDDTLNSTMYNNGNQNVKLSDSTTSSYQLSEYKRLVVDKQGKGPLDTISTALLANDFNTKKTYDTISKNKKLLDAFIASGLSSIEEFNQQLNDPNSETSKQIAKQGYADITKAKAEGRIDSNGNIITQTPQQVLADAKKTEDSGKDNSSYDVPYGMDKYGPLGYATQSYDRQHSSDLERYNRDMLNPSQTKIPGLGNQTIAENAQNQRQAIMMGRESVTSMASTMQVTQPLANSLGQNTSGLDQILLKSGAQGQQQFTQQIQGLAQADQFVKMVDAQKSAMEQLAASQQANTPEVQAQLAALKETLATEQQRYEISRQYLGTAKENKNLLLDQANAIMKQNTAAQRIVIKGTPGTPAQFQAPNLFDASQYSTDDLNGAFKYAKEKQDSLGALNPGYKKQFASSQFMLESGNQFKGVTGIDQGFVNEYLAKQKQVEKVPDLVDLSKFSDDKSNKIVERARELQGQAESIAPQLKDQDEKERLILMRQGNKLMGENGLAQKYLQIAMDENTKATEDTLRGHYNLPSNYQMPTVWDYYDNGAKDKGDVNYKRPGGDGKVDLSFAKDLAQAALDNKGKDKDGPDLSKLVGTSTDGARPLFYPTAGTPGTPDKVITIPGIDTDVFNAQELNILSARALDDPGLKDQRKGERDQGAQSTADNARDIIAEKNAKRLLALNENGPTSEPTAMQKIVANRESRDDIVTKVAKNAPAYAGNRQVEGFFAAVNGDASIPKPAQTVGAGGGSEGDWGGAKEGIKGIASVTSTAAPKLSLLGSAATEVTGAIGSLKNIGSTTFSSVSAALGSDTAKLAGSIALTITGFGSVITSLAALQNQIKTLDFTKALVGSPITINVNGQQMQGTVTGGSQTKPAVTAGPSSLTAGSYPNKGPR